MSSNLKSIPTSEIKVGYRIRKEEGNLMELADSIRNLGLLSPITVMELSEGGYQLIAGQRRLMAVTAIGMKQIDATILTTVESDRQLMMEIAENEKRKDFTVSERLEYSQTLKSVEAEKAKQRKAAGGMGGLAHEDTEDVANRPHLDQGRARDIVAKKAGFTSQQQMRRAEVVAERKPELLPKIDAGEMSIHGAYQEAVREPSFQPDPVYADAPTKPQVLDNRRMTRQEREKLKSIEEQLIKQENVVPFEVFAEYHPDQEDAEAFAARMADVHYAALYRQYEEALFFINRLRGDAERRCENYEKVIRSYKENLAFCRNRIAELEERVQ